MLKIVECQKVHGTERNVCMGFLFAHNAEVETIDQKNLREIRHPSCGIKDK